MGATGLVPVDGKGAKELNGPLWKLIADGQTDQAFDHLAPVLEQAVPFRLLDILSTPPGPVSWEAMDRFLEKIATTRAMGGWVIIATALKAQIALDPWREDENRWVRRSIGVAAHFWAKRCRGAPARIPAAKALLDFLAPLFEERNADAVKGIGWVLKTLGRYYPQLVVPCLEEQVLRKRRPHRALMLRKAITYLPDGDKAALMGHSQKPQREG